MTDEKPDGVQPPQRFGRTLHSPLGVQRLGDVAVVTPRGMLLGGAETDAFEREVDRCLESAPKALILDLGATEHLDSRSIGILQAAHRKAARLGIPLLLCNVNARIQHTLAVVQLGKVLRILDTRAHCLESLDRT